MSDRQNGHAQVAPAFDSLDARAVMGCLLFYGDKAVAEIDSALSDSLFFDPLTKWSYRAFEDLRANGDPADAITVTGWLRDHKKLELVGGPAEVAGLCGDGAAMPSTIRTHLDKLRDQEAQRQCMEAVKHLSEVAEAGYFDREDVVGRMKGLLEKLERPAALDTAPRVEFLSPSEVRAFLPPEGYNLCGDHHVQRGSPFVIGGAPGVGKSRAATALAVAGATGADWFGLPVHQKFRTMILQAENGRMRLKDEYSDLDLPVYDEFIRVCPPPPFGFSFNDHLFCSQLRAAIDAFEPAVFIIDPWNRATSDDKSKDYLDTFRTLQNIMPTGDKAPALGIVAHTRKPGQGERTNGRALLNILAGGYALGSVPRSAFVIQHASDDAEEDKVIFNTVKNNDGQLGPRSAWIRCNGLFQPVSDFDWQEFDTPGEKRRAVTENDLEAVFSDGENGWLTIPRGEAVNLLIERTNLGKTACYKALEFTGMFKNRLKEKQGGITLK